MNYYKRHLGDYAKNTRTLTTYEHGVYNLVLDLYYTDEEPVLTDDAYAICRADTAKDRAAVDRVLSKFFKPEGAAWRHGRADEEIAEYHETAQKNRENGKAGGRPKVTQNKPKNNPVGSQTVSETEPKQNPSHKPLAISHTQTIPPTADGEPVADPIFGNGLAFLVRKGTPEKGARSFLGAMRKEVRDDLVIAELLIEAERQDVSDPLAWLRKAGRARASPPKAKPSVADSFASKTYEGTPENELPIFLRADTASP